MDNYGPEMREMIQGLAKHVPMKRLGLEAEVSAAICFLLSPAAAFITGATLPIDGGAPLGNRAFPLQEAARGEAFEGFHRATAPDVLNDAGA
jgi:citronellol/citronellal dehydrogenase